MRTSVPQIEHRYWIFTLRSSPGGGGSRRLHSRDRVLRIDSDNALKIRLGRPGRLPLPGPTVPVIWNGEDLERFSPGPSPVRRELGLPAEALLIVSVGLLGAVQDEAELAFVLAHEIAHITQLHLYRALEKQKAMTIPIALAMLSDWLADVVGAAIGLLAGAASWRRAFPGPENER